MLFSLTTPRPFRSQILCPYRFVVTKILNELSAQQSFYGEPATTRLLQTSHFFLLTTAISLFATVTLFFFYKT